MKKDFLMQKNNCYAIRKLSVGTASVLLGACFLMTHQVSADQLSPNQIITTTESITNQPTNLSSETTTVTESATLVNQPDNSQIAPETEPSISSETNTTKPSPQIEKVTDKTSQELTETKPTAEPKVVPTVDQSTPVIKETTVPKTSPVPKATTPTLPSSGHYIYTKKTEVKNAPKLSEPLAFYVNAGDQVNYDRVLIADGFQWISYISYNGIRRYAAIEALKQEQVKPSAKITVKNQSTTGFDLLISQLKDSKGIKAVKVPIWTSKNNQDDIIWYDAVKQSNGDYSLTVKNSKHKNEVGEYQIHLYIVEPDGKKVFAAKTSVKLEANKPVTPSNNLPSSGTYIFTQEVNVKSQAKLSAKTEFTFAKGESIQYDKVLMADNHQWLSYVSFSGVRRYIDIADLSNINQKNPTSPTKPSIPNAPTSPKVPLNIPKSGSYSFSQNTDVRNEPKISSPVVFYYPKGEKVLYDQVFFADGHQWIRYISGNGTRRFIAIN